MMKEPEQVVPKGLVGEGGRLDCLLDRMLVFQCKTNIAVGQLCNCICIVCQIRDLETELDLEQRRSREASGEAKKFQRMLTEMRSQADDDHRQVGELTDQVGTLQTRIVTIKRQLEESVCCYLYHIIGQFCELSYMGQVRNIAQLDEAS